MAILKKAYNDKGLIINRMPPEKRKVFIEIAHKEYCGDYGWCLSSLIDHALVLQPIVAKIDALEADVKRLRLPPAKEEKKGIKLMDGSELKNDK